MVNEINIFHVITRLKGIEILELFNPFMICSANQWTDFCMITASVMKESVISFKEISEFSIDSV